MKLMFTTRYAGLCLCLLVTVCLASCSVFNRQGVTYVSPANPNCWVLKAGFRSRVDPEGQSYDLASTIDTIAGSRLYGISHTHGIWVFEYHCSDLEQCKALEQELNSFGGVILISIHEISE